MFGKLAFIHRLAWRQDGYYRAAVLLGPAALLGGAAAGIVWLGLHRALAPPPPAWAMPLGQAQNWNAADDAVHLIVPSVPIPATGADGALAGFQPGWRVHDGTLRPSAVDVDLLPDHRIDYTQASTPFDMAALVAKGGTEPLYAAVASGYLVVRKAGDYALSARLERPPGPTASCLTRLVFGRLRVVSVLNLGLKNDVERTYDAVRFRLAPGLYAIAAAFACWHGDTMSRTGRMTLMIAHPGDPALLPVRADEIVRRD